MITVLLKAGADGTIVSDEGKTAFDYAAGNPKLKGTAAYKALEKALTPPPPATAPATTAPAGAAPATTAPKATTPAAPAAKAPAAPATK
jgi:hypothetical protein